MPLQTRRPELAHITVPTLTFFESGDPVTPLPFTPMPYDQCHPLILTPTMSMLELDLVLDTPIAGCKRSRPLPSISPIAGGDDEGVPKLEWDSREDGIVQSFLTHPLHPLSSPFPPSTIPPPGALDELTSQIMHYHRAPSSLSSSTSLPQLSAVASTREPSLSHLTQQPKTRPRAATSTGWKHSWAETRQRLFELARKESREAIGGVSKRPRGSKPEISRNNSMAFLETGKEEQSGIGEVLRLSTSLQKSSRTGASGGSAEQSSHGLSSPLSFSPVASRRGSLTSGNQLASQPRSLLSRGRSFTADDFDSYISTRTCTSPTHAGEDSDTDVEDEGTPHSAPVSKPKFSMSFTPVYRDAQDDTPAIKVNVQAPSPKPTSRARQSIIERGTPSRSPSPTPALAFNSLSLGSPTPKRTLTVGQPVTKRQRLFSVAVPPAGTVGWTDAGLRSPFEEGPARIAF